MTTKTERTWLIQSQRPPARVRVHKNKNLRDDTTRPSISIGPRLRSQFGPTSDDNRRIGKNGLQCVPLNTSSIGVPTKGSKHLKSGFGSRSRENSFGSVRNSGALTVTHRGTCRFWSETRLPPIHPDPLRSTKLPVVDEEWKGGTPGETLTRLLFTRRHRSRPSLGSRR